MRPSVPVAVQATVLVIAISRFALAFYSATIFADGDFRLTVPSVFSLHPATWEMPLYLHGPTQYVTLLPLGFTGSYDALARLLLWIYTALIVLAAVLSCRSSAAVSERPVPAMLVFASTLAFPPLLDAFVDREFEVVIVAAWACAYRAALADRLPALGSWIAYISLYKYLPFVTVVLLVARGWWRAVVAFGMTAATILAVTSALLGLGAFLNNTITAKAEMLATGMVSLSAFCSPVTIDGDDASIRADLCRLNRSAALPIYLSLTLGTAALLTVGMRRFRKRGPLQPIDEGWRRALELSVAIVITTTFFYTHYFYLAVLILPLNLLLVRLIDSNYRSYGRLALWLLSYLLLGAFLAPPALVQRWAGIDVPALYAATYAGTIGTLMLLGLILQEYLELSQRTHASAAAATP